MYQESIYSGKLKNTITGDIFPQDCTHELYPDFLLWLQNENTLTFVPYFSEEESMVLEQNSLNSETNKYIQRTKDGRAHYACISAEFRIAKLNGTISEETHGYIERLLIPVRNEVLAGQWISAKNELEIIGPLQVGEELYNRLHSQITEYISLNY